MTEQSTDVTDQSIRLAGDRLGFLLIHGLGGTPMELRYVAHGLAGAGHTVHVPQLAGHCGTLDELKATAWTEWYASVEREHERLGARCSGVVVGWPLPTLPTSAPTCCGSCSPGPESTRPPSTT